MDTTTTEPAYRDRLLSGLAEVLERKSYRDITLADIAAAARVSRRTFYEQFSNKDECLLALADHTSNAILATVLQVYSPAKAWSVLVHDITCAYLAYIESKPQLMRALHVELAALGEPGVRMRRKVAEQFARFLQDQVAQQRDAGEVLQPLSLPMGMALVAGINELILYALSEKDGSSLKALAPIAEELVHRVVGRTP
jgi:AcrR family transcriptional regulator